MRLRAEARVWLERVFRAATLVILGVMLWRSTRVGSSKDLTSVAGTASLADLEEWTASAAAPSEARIILDSVPRPAVRDWLTALRRAGTRIAWTGQLSPIAVTASAVPSPAHTTSVLVAAPSGSMVQLRDPVAPFDSVNSANGGARFVVQGDGPFIAVESSSRATTPRTDSAILRRILILGEAGWEAKFTTAALEETGWKVDAMMHVAPSVDVSQNAGYHIDTARYSGVVALDESAGVWASAIEEYVRSGGGVIIGPAAAGKLPATLRAGTAGTAITHGTTTSAGPVTLEKTALSPLQSLRSDAVVLGRRGEAAAIAARRHSAGRVIEIGYPESWRWRMAGDEAAIENHRQWWSGLVSAVAYSPRVALRVSTAEMDNAPFAGLVSAIGPASPSAEIARPPLPSSHSMAWLAILLSFTFLAEIASRRLRGAK